MLRTTLTFDELAQLESALASRLAPLRAAGPSASAMAVARGALLSRTGATLSADETGGMRRWHRGAILGAAIAAPFAAGGAFAAIPAENLVAVPQFAAQSFVNAISSTGSQPSSSVGLLESEEDSSEPETNGEEPAANDEPTNDLEDPNGGDEPSGETPLTNGELDAGATESFIPPGHEICFEANATARARLAELLERDDLSDEQREDLETSLAALENCGLGLDDEDAAEEEDAASEESETEEDNGNGNGHATCFAATEHARGVLTRLLEKLPPQGAAGVQNALAAIERCGLGEEEADEGETENGSDAPAPEESTATASEPARGGPPPHAGPPAGVGPNRDAEEGQPGRPENAGPPPHTGPPAGVGPNRDAENSDGDPSTSNGDATPSEEERRGGPPPYAGPPAGVGPNSGNSDTGAEQAGPGSAGGPPPHAGPPAGVGGGGSERGGGPPAGVGRNR